ncbi:MAG: acylphosphatase [Magnetococcales bacterium]|nr:acylphosphatase [Magnetococcales bacterium]
MCRQVRMTGRVQGVWFRESTRREAERLGASGWVRNLPDGSVEARIYGPPAVVEALVAWCRQGSPMAQVLGFTDDFCSEESGSPPSGFRIRR